MIRAIVFIDFQVVNMDCLTSSRKFTKNVVRRSLGFLGTDYWSVSENDWVVGPYKDRKRIMITLCNKAGVKYFRFHALRHFGASMLESDNIPIGTVQRILGHEDRKTTEIYLHSVGDGERLAVDCLGKSFDEISHTDSHTKHKGATVVKP